MTEWVELPDGAEALSIDGGGMDGGAGMMIANAPNRDLHVLGSFAPLAPFVGCVAVHPDGSREVVRVERDPLAEQPDS